MLKLQNVSKIYPGVIALNHVSLEFKQGEVHALMGENGAGKSTLIKVVSGAIEPSEGTIILGGKEYKKMTPALSRENKVAVIYQDINLVQPLSIAENIFMGQHHGKMFNFRKICKMAQELFDEYGFDLKPEMKVNKLSPANQQLVEICKAISNDCKIMIMDEPTAPLATAEVELLFSVIKKLKEKGVTVIYISHRLDEVFQISDRISILRDGCYIKTLNTCDTNRPELVSLMVGRQFKEQMPERHNEIGEVVLKVDNISGNSVDNISFELHKGEVLGFAGLVGSGRTETMELIYGAHRITSGDIYVNGKKVKLKEPADGIKHGIGLIPEDRKELGVIMFNTVEFNTNLISLKNICKFGFINQKKRKEIAEKYKAAMRIKVPSIKNMVMNLSGGNQQKVVVAKTMAADLDIVIFDEPTKGIDVGAKQEIYQLMNDMVANGKAIIMVSSDMEEVLGMSDRIIVLHEGLIAGELTKEEFSQENVLALASGLSKEVMYEK